MVTSHLRGSPKVSRIRSTLPIFPFPLWNSLLFLLPHFPSNLRRRLLVGSVSENKLQAQLVFLNSVYLFSEFGGQSLKKIFFMMQVRQYTSGMVVYREGQKPEQMFLIRQGDFELTKYLAVEDEASKTPVGSQQKRRVQEVRIGTLGGGQLAGEFEFFSGLPREYNLRCKSRTSLVLSLDRALFLREMGQFGLMLEKMQQLVEQRHLVEVQNTIEQLRWQREFNERQKVNRYSDLLVNVRTRIDMQQRYTLNLDGWLEGLEVYKRQLESGNYASGKQLQRAAKQEAESARAREQQQQASQQKIRRRLQQQLLRACCTTGLPFSLVASQSSATVAGKTADEYQLYSAPPPGGSEAERRADPDLSLILIRREGHAA